MKISLRSIAILLVACLAVALSAADTKPAVKATDFYFVDIGHGNVTVVVSPEGEVMMLDCGPSRAVDRIYGFLTQNGFDHIDFLVFSHFEDDHMGAMPRLSAKIPISNVVDHGESVVYGKSDEWWKGRRGPWFRENMGKGYDDSFDLVRKAREKSRHIVVKPGDSVPVKGLDVRIVSAGGKILTAPLPGAGQLNPNCNGIDRRAEDDAEDGQSVGVVIGSGKFRFIFLGDLTWNTANNLFCPTNLVGRVDAYLITHHSQGMTTELGEYYGGLSCCSPGEVGGLSPRVAFLSMGMQGHKYGTPDALKVVHSTKSVEDVWQTEKIIDGGEKGENSPDQFIANIGGRTEQVPYIKMSARPDGSFTVFNSRNQFTKTYPVRKAAK